MDDLNLLVDTVGRLSKERVRPHVGDLDLAPSRTASIDLRDVFGDLGLFDARDGAVLDPASAVPVLWTLASECAGVATFAAWVVAGQVLARRHGLPARSGAIAIALWDDADVALDAGVPPMDTTLDDGRVRGKKRGVALAPVADALIVLCAGGPNRDQPKLAWIEAGPGRGVTVGPPLGMLGLRAVPTADVTFDGARAEAAVDLSAHEFAYLVGLLGLFSATCACATATAAVGAARAYAQERYQGGSMIAAYDAVRILLGRHEAALASARSAIGAAADLHAGADGAAVPRASLHARLAVGLVAVRATIDAVQILGGYGYMRDFGVEKRLRDAIALSLLPADDARLALFAEFLGREG